MSHRIEEYYRVHVNQPRRARREHKCCACGEAILPSDIYNVISIVDHDRRTSSYKRCVRCEAIHAHLVERGDGDTWPAEELDCGEDYASHWGEEPSEEIAALAFVTREEAQARFAKAGAS